MNIYDQLRQFQIIPGAFDNWKEYRNSITNMIKSTTMSGSSAHIIGAGPCNDIDIYELSKHFSSIILSDRDISASVAYEKLDNVSCKEFDYIGITDNDYRQLCDELRYIAVNSNGDYENYANDALKCYEKLFANVNIIDWSLPVCDYVICIGIHSQLINMCAWIWQAFSDNLGIKDEIILRYIKEQNNRIINDFNNNIEKLSKKCTIIGLENRSYDKSPVEGAYQAINYYENLGYKRTYNIKWPFDAHNNVVYDMNIYHIWK